MRLTCRIAVVGVAVFLGGCKPTGDTDTRGVVNTKEIAQQAYVYALPMIAGYKAIYGVAVDSGGPGYRGSWNQVHSDHRVFTPADKIIVTPNSDTPYSMLALDVRAEPLVVCVPTVDKKRYYSVQIIDLNTFIVGYIGSRATGNDAGCYLIGGPDWKGAAPAGVAKAFTLGSQLGIAIFRTQLFGPSDMSNVEKVQAGYVAEPLSAFLKQPAPPASPPINFPAFTDSAFKTDFIRYENFLLQFIPVVPEEKVMRDQFAQIGMAPGQPFDFSKLSEVQKGAMALALKDGYASIEDRVKIIGKVVNGWNVGAAFGDRAFYNGDYTLRAAAAIAGLYGNAAVEALYPATKIDSAGRPLDASQHDYAMTFAAGALPPVNAFWSVTMYDGKTQLLVENPIRRYLINSPMLRGMMRNADGSLTLYIQEKSPGKGRESNWLPAPNGPAFLVMRLYWPKESALSGAWSPPAVKITH
jgi:hypothetical protein